MITAKPGNTVHVHYTGTLKDGSIFDSSEGRETLKFQVGAGQMIAGFDKAVEGMQKGEVKDITIPAAEAYGTYRTDLVQEISKDLLPAGMEFAPGMQLQGSSDAGYPLLLSVKEVLDDSIVVDANHELAGKDLNFRIELVEVVAE